eukprot:jgi/Botrbrau1/21626/Bobra.43_1s0028.1
MTRPCTAFDRLELVQGQVQASNLQVWFSHTEIRPSSSSSKIICSRREADFPFVAPRRHILRSLCLVPLLGLSSKNAKAEEATTVEEESIKVLPQGVSSPIISKGELYETPDFSLIVPAGFELILDTAPLGPQKSFAQERGERGRGVEQASSPVKARFKSVVGEGSISVIQRESSKIKPTFLQLADISQWGSAEDAARLLLPRGIKLLSVQAKQIEMPARDTGTVLGVVKVPPQTIYMYAFTLPNGTRFAVAAAAKAGQVYVAGASAPSSQWDAAGPVLEKAIASFKLSPVLPAA